MNASAGSREQARCKLAAQVLLSSGRLRLRATGTSMLPTLCPGDVLTIQQQLFSRVLPGDLILYTRHDRFFVHRVIRKFIENGRPMLLTCGDALSQPDTPVSAQEFLGIVVGAKRDRPMTARAGFHSRLHSLLRYWYDKH